MRFLRGGFDRQVPEHRVRVDECCLLRHCDDYFSFGVSFSKIAESIRHLAKRVSFINHRDDFTRFQKLFEQRQILWVWFQRQGSQLLTIFF